MVREKIANASQGEEKEEQRVCADVHRQESNELFADMPLFHHLYGETAPV